MFTASRLSPLNLVVLVRLIGPAIDDLLPAALDALQQRHPLLRARIIGTPGRPRFHITEPAESEPAESGSVPLRRLRADDAEHAFVVAEAEMNTPFDPAVAPLARLTCVSGPGSATDLILTLHHAIADGTSAANLVHELLGWCQEGLCGQATTPAEVLGRAPTSVPPPLTDLMPAGLRGFQGARKRIALLGRESRDEITYRLGSRASKDSTGSKGRRRPVPPAGRALLRPLHLDPAHTAALVSQGRRQRLTLVSLLAAALLWQVNAVLYAGRPEIMRAVIWIDLRPYLDQHVGEEVLGCYISLLRFLIRVDPGNGFTALAADVQRQIERIARRGDRLPAAQLSAALTRLAVCWPISRLGTVALSHATAPAIRSAYGPVTVREVRAFVSNNRIGAELAAVSGLNQGALWCDLLYLDSDYGEATATALGDGLLSVLRQFSERA